MMINLFAIPANRELDKIITIRDLMTASIDQGLFLDQIYQYLPMFKSAWPDFPDDIYNYWLGTICFHYYLNSKKAIVAKNKDIIVEGNCYHLNRFRQKKLAVKEWLDRAIDYFDLSMAIDPLIVEYKFFYILAINERNDPDDQIIRSKLLKQMANKDLRWQIIAIIRQIKRKQLPDNYLVDSLQILSPIAAATN